MGRLFRTLVPTLQRCKTHRTTRTSSQATASLRARPPLNQSNLKLRALTEVRPASALFSAAACVASRFLGCALAPPKESPADFTDASSGRFGFLPHLCKFYPGAAGDTWERPDQHAPLTRSPKQSSGPSVRSIHSLFTNLFTACGAGFQVSRTRCVIVRSLVRLGQSLGAE